MSESYSRNIVHQVIYEFLRGKITRLPGWVKNREESFRELYNADDETMELLYGSEVIVDPYTRDVQFAWLGRSCMLQVRVLQASDATPEPAQLQGVPQKIRHGDKLSRNVLRDIARRFLVAKLGGMPHWLSIRADKLGEQLKIAPVTLQKVSFDDLECIDEEQLLFTWADKLFRLSVTVSNEE